MFGQEVIAKYEHCPRAVAADRIPRLVHIQTIRLSMRGEEEKRREDSYLLDI